MLNKVKKLILISALLFSFNGWAEDENPFNPWFEDLEYPILVTRGNYDGAVVHGQYSTIGIESPNQEDGVQYLFSAEQGVGSYWEPNEQGFYENIAIKFIAENNISEDPQCGQMDINSDGVANVIDIVALVNTILSGANMDEEVVCAYDVSGDGIVNVIDIVALVNYILS